MNRFIKHIAYPFLIGLLIYITNELFMNYGLKFILFPLVDSINFLSFLQILKFVSFSVAGFILYHIGYSFNIQSKYDIDLLDKIQQLDQERTALYNEVVSKRRMLRCIIDIIPDFIFLKDASGAFVVVNKAVADCYNKHPRELIGKKHLAFTKDDAEVLNTNLPKKGILEQISCFDKEKMFLTNKYPCDIWDSRKGVLCISKDITDVLKLIDELDSHCKKRDNLLDFCKKIVKGE